MKQKTLLEHSKNYLHQTNIYEKFVQCEDHPKKILNFLAPYVMDKMVLDLGCGEGTYARALAPKSKYYYGLDSSSAQLKKAKLKCRNLKNVKFFHSRAEKIPLKTQAADLVISTWVVSTVVSHRKRTKILTEAQRVLKDEGKIILVENDCNGEFEKIRMHPRRTKQFNEWLIKKGFKKVKKIETYFKFPSHEEAEEIFRSIWGRRVSNQIKNSIIRHKVNIYVQEKIS
jgi:ubiquinone/menaquinone biosynthesis C-methylase UbiE